MHESNIDDIKHIGKMIKFYRNKIHISQQELAYRADIDIRTVQRIEKGQYSFGIDILITIAKLLNICPKDLFK